MEGLRFANSSYLYWILALPLYYWLVIFWRNKKHKMLSKHFGEEKRQFLLSSLDEKKVRRRVWLEMGIVFCVLMALARPQVPGGTQTIRDEGVELLLVVDVSKSMLSEDIKPNRLAVTKRELTRLVQNSPGDRFGLVAFAGSAVLLSPMTTDRGAIQMFLESLSTDTVSSQGTNFAEALEVAGEAFIRGGTQEEVESAVTQVILVASDGEDHQEGAMKMAAALAEKGYRIFTLALGTEKGGPIPEKGPQGQTRGFVKDKQGKPVLSQLKPEALQKLAEQGEGTFHHFSFNSDVVSDLRSDLDQLQKAGFNEGKMVTYDEQFQFFLFCAFLLSLFYFWVGERSSPHRIWKGRFVAGRS